MEYADLVIPVATFLECAHPLASFGPWLMAPSRAVEPLGDYGSDIDFWVQLGCRMGYAPLFWYGDVERSFDEQLAPTGLTMAELRRHPFGVTAASLPRVYERYEEFFGALSPRLDRSPYLHDGGGDRLERFFRGQDVPPVGYDERRAGHRRNRSVSAHRLHALDDDPRGRSLDRKSVV